jgi:IMP dehydrogenase
VPEGMAAEGESTFVNIKGHVKDVIAEMTGGIRSGMSYVNATSIAEIKDKARFMQMSAAGANESRAHGVQ